MFSFDLGDGDALRLYSETDAGELHAVIEANRERLAEWMPWAAEQTIEETLEFIRAARRRYGEEGTFDAAILSGGAISGGVGIARLDSANRSASIGYWLAADDQGRGLVTRAAAALLDNGFGAMQLHRIEIRAGVENRRSRAVAERLGCTHEGTLRDTERIGERWISHAVYSMLADEWLTRRRAVWGAAESGGVGASGSRPGSPPA